MTAKGEELIRSLGERVVGPGSEPPQTAPTCTCTVSADNHTIRAEILDPRPLSHVLVSPRTRAQHTYELLFSGVPESQRPSNKVIDERVREWTYGDFEGALAKDVNAERALRGEKKWDIVGDNAVADHTLG